MTKKQRSLRIEDKIISIDPVLPHPVLIEEAAGAIKKGGVVLFPTRSLYGLAADAFSEESVDRVYRIKKRSPDKPLLVLVKNRAAVYGLVRDVPPAAEVIMEKIWPGRITIVFKAAGSLPGNLTAGTGKIGIRVPGHAVASALVKSLDTPITGTSANISNEEGCARVSELDTGLADGLDLILDAGTLHGGTGSTVVDVTADPPVILREGAVVSKDILETIA